MSLKDYLEQYDVTTFAAECDASKLQHSNFLHNFTLDKLAFFSFEVTKQIDLSAELFSISVIQQGKRIESYRNKVLPKRFQPSDFSIMLMSEEGKWMDATHGGSQSFNFSLVLKEGFLFPGRYYLLIDPTWHESAAWSNDYKKCLIDIYSSLNLQIDLVQRPIGNQILASTLKYVAKTMVP